MGSKESPKDGHAVALNCYFACAPLRLLSPGLRGGH